ncbi:MAG TPA: hypothetical protein VMA77_12430 [Solirubrobacteraceae bacterium]|nr:hypothetical protein [Solirubrobacteraceae bacterium]
MFDCLELYADLRRSYEEHAKPDILTDLSTAQRRLDKLLEYDNSKAAQLLAGLPADGFPLHIDVDLDTLETPAKLRQPPA